jgi:hypothetical protein
MTPTIIFSTLEQIKNQVDLPSWISFSETILLHQGDALVPENLLLDWEKGWITDDFIRKWFYWNKVEVPHNLKLIGGLVILGNLIIKGSIINAEGDSGPFLIVKGDVKADNLVCGGSFIRIDGNADIAEVVFGHYNHGELDIRGLFGARILINDDHNISISNFGQNNIARRASKDTLDKGCVLISTDELYSEIGRVIPKRLKKVISKKLVSWPQVQANLFKGESILSEEGDHATTTIEEWVPIIWESPNQLRKVPNELRTESFYLALFSNDCPMSKSDIAELFASLPKKALTLKVRVAAFELAPKSLLQLPLSYDLQKEYNECFKWVKNPDVVFLSIPDQFKSDVIRERLDEFLSADSDYND